MQFIETQTRFKSLRHDIIPYTYPASSSFTLTIQHSLGFIPLALVYCVNINSTTKEVNSRFPLPGNVGSYIFTFNSAGEQNWLDFTVDSTSLIITFKASISGTSIRNFDDFFNPIYFEYFLFEASGK